MSSKEDRLLDRYELRFEQELSLNKTQVAHARQIASDLMDETEAQAEISFKAGRREVVEFIAWLDNGTRSSASWRAEMRKFRQAQLKEWGVK